LQEQWDKERPRYDCRFFGLRWPKENLHLRIKERVQRMFERGLVGEVKSLLASGRPLSTAAKQAVGYAEIIAHFQGGPDLEQTVEAIKINTRQLAKGQRTWFQRFRTIEWIELTTDATVQSVADSVIERFPK